MLQLLLFTSLICNSTMIQETYVKTTKLGKDITVNSLKGAVVGAGIVVGAGALSGLAVPYAMSTFGTVVSGVGTMHAVGGVAANLQIMNQLLLSQYSVAVGSGVCAGWNALKPIKRFHGIRNYISQKKNGTRDE